MKTLINRFYPYLTMLICVYYFSSCAKNPFDKDYTGFDGKVYMSQAVSSRSKLSLPLSSKPFVLGYGASFGGTAHPSEKDIPIVFELKNEWINDYNTKNGTSYIPLPQNSFSISGYNSVIKAGKTTSDSLVIRIESKKLELTKKYLLPLTIVSAGSAKIDSAFQTTWFRIDTIVRAERDVTSKGVLSVRKDNNGGSGANEGSLKLVDNNIDTKFLIFGANEVLPDFWYQLKFADPIVLGAYTMTSANDAPERDPKTWNFSGSNDGINWVVLDTRANQAFSARKQTQRFEFQNDKPFTFYRISISELFGATTLFQQAEWRVIEFFEQ